MSVIGSNILAGASGQGGEYTLTRSLRFRSSASAYLNRTPASAGNRKTWTYSTWIKRGSLGSLQGILGCVNGQATNSDLLGIVMTASDQLQVSSLTTWRVTTQVFRDPSAWYHIIVAWDTTQATASNRVKIYVNGVQVTSFGTSNDPTLNLDGGINQAYVHGINRDQYYSSYYFDGYTAETHFIDGQALTPSSFGQTSSTTGVWQPKKYAGTYGTNGFYLPFNVNTTATYGGYVTDVSSNYVSLPTGSQGSNFTFTGDFTIEGWVNYPSASGDSSLYVQESGSSYLALNIDMAGGVYNIYCNSSSPSGIISHGMTAGQWNHVAMVRSGSTITLYTNGVAKGTITNSSTLGFSSLTLNRFGGGASGARYLSNVRITKSAVYTSAFTPSAIPLTNIANTVCLTFQSATLVDNSSNAYTLTQTGTTTLSIQYPFSTGSSVANDQSGQGNNWTANNISLTTGSTYDSMLDVPTLTSATASNFAVLSPIAIAHNGTAGTLSNGNLDLSTPVSGNGGTISTIAIPSTGKWYWEFVKTGGSASSFSGIYEHIGNLTSNRVIYYQDGTKFVDGTNSSYGASYTTNDIIGVAVDSDAGTVTFYKNNTSQGAISRSVSSGAFFPFLGDDTGGAGMTFNINFGQRPFAYTPPTGYVALNTYNLPTPTIGATASSQANKYFDALLYTGNGSASQRTDISWANMQPDMVWIKSRSNAYNNDINDDIRGVTQALCTNSTAVEDGPVAFGSDGFGYNGVANQLRVYTSDQRWNANSATYVAWGWKASGAAGVTNTAGSITSTVSANTTSGFSVVTYTGNGTGGATVGHGLGVAPKMIIVKNRVQGTYGNWNVWHTAITGSQYLSLNLTDAVSTNNNRWNGTTPTSTVFSLGADSFGNTNKNGDTYVAYCFSEVQGYSKFGSYTGNGSTDGVFVYTGFRPKFILIKRTDAINDWVMYDTTRNTYNEIKDYLEPNTSDAESVGTNDRNIDILSNGFKLRYSGNAINGSGGTFVYACFSENPFKYSLAR